MILDRDPDNDFGIAPCGSKPDILGLFELRKATFPSLLAPVSAGEMRRILRACADEAAPVVAGLSVAPCGRPKTFIEAIFLPLLDNNGENDGLLCGLSTSCAQPWIGKMGMDRIELTTIRFLNVRMTSVARASVRNDASSVGAVAPRDENRRLCNLYFGLSADLAAFRKADRAKGVLRIVSSRP
ncbi:hypothetical protein GGD83_002827 [Rhodoblastus sphagnicola]|nr:hypothetical protein [Rhodoblastus sphagnicola]